MEQARATFGLSVQAHEVRFFYGQVRALDGFSLTVDEGAFVAIVGPNGSGKSTFVRVVSGVVRPQRGKVLLGERDLAEMSALEVARCVAVAPQRVELGFDVSVKEFVLLGRLPYLRRFGGETRRDLEAAEGAMEATETVELQARRMGELSGGERQRAVLAKALAQDPKFLVLDEPTTHLDIHHQMEVLRLVRNLNRQRGMTVLSILHDVNLAAQYCDEVAVVKQGRVLRAGPVREVMTREVLGEAFGVEVMVREDVVSGRPFVVPLEPMKGPENRNNGRVHLVCGGGTGFRLMEELCRAGVSVTAGVLNVGDTDYLVAKRLGVEVAEEAPFREISEKSARRCEEMVKGAEVVVVTDVPFGPANIRNLQIVLETQAAGVQRGRAPRKVFMNYGDMEKRDFSSGRASKLMDDLANLGALRLPDDLGQALRAVVSALRDRKESPAKEVTAEPAPPWKQS